ncbi:MAG: lipopolysaccharide biosynthesis protein, partial [Isosphaeraceae bacterium]|nr:lipopolysaccharide biosynthesis protein [Isosphaeraceae bacterium]
MTRTRLAAWNYATTLLFTATTLVTGLAITPWIVDGLGDTRYGAYRTLAECLGHFALLELGLGGALGPLLARAAGRDDAHALRATLAAGVRAYGGVALICVAVGLALAPWIDRLIPVGPAYVADLRRAWLIGVVGFLPLTLSPFRALVESRQRGYRVNLLLTAQAVVVAVLALLLARQGWGITGQSLAIVLGTGLVALVLASEGLRQHPGVVIAARRRPDPEAWAALWSLSPPTLLMNACGRLGLLTDYLIVSLILEPAVVTPLYLTQRLAVLAQGQLQAVGNAAWAGLAELHARGQHEAFARRLVELTHLVAVLGVAALAPIVAYNRHFVLRWVGREMAGGDMIILVAALNALFQGVLSLWGWCFSGTTLIRRILAPTIAWSLINLAASVTLTWRLGPIGPLLGTTTSFVAAGLWGYAWELRRTFGVPLRSLAAAVLGPLAWGTPYAAGLWWLARTHRPWGYLGLAFEMGLAALGFLALAWAVVLGPDERALWRFRLAALVRRGDRAPRSH